MAPQPQDVIHVLPGWEVTSQPPCGGPRDAGQAAFHGGILREVTRWLLGGPAGDRSL